MYKKLKEEESQVMSVRTVNEKLRRCVLHQIPKPLHFKILKEMERYRLIELINGKKGYRILHNEEYRKLSPPLI